MSGNKKEKANQKLAEKNNSNNSSNPSSLQKTFGGIKIDFSLTEKQKQFTAAFFAIILVAAISFGVAFYTNPNFKSFIFQEKQVTDTKIEGSELDANLANLGQSLTKLNVDDILYDIINLEDLPVYPKAWVEKFFSLSERQNSLISGPSADPDVDGLSNKQEFFFGSNPRNKDSLCLGKTDRPECKGQTDGQNVANNISPLTGGVLSKNRSFKVNKQNSKLLDTLQNSFENSSREGVDFPSLYQLSKEINLEDYFNSFKVSGVEDNRDSFGKYLQIRTDIIQGFIEDSELNSLTEIYATNDVSQLNVVKDLYQSRFDTLKSTAVPNRYVQTHKAYLVIFSKIVALVDYRIAGIGDNTIDNEDYKTGSKKLAVETVWGYKKLSEEIAKLNGK